MEDHTHGEDGSVILVSPAPEEVAAEAVVATADAAVAVAEVEAARDVELAKVNLKAEQVREQRWADEDFNRMSGELVALREIVDRLAPPEPTDPPAPIVIDPGPAEPAEPVVAEPPVSDPTPPAKKSSGLSWF